MDRIDIGKRIKHFRRINNIDQTVMAKNLGILQTKLSKIERNEQNFDILLLMNDICKYFNITLDQFLHNDMKTIIALTDEQKELIEVTKNLSPEKMKQLIQFLR